MSNSPTWIFPHPDDPAVKDESLLLGHKNSPVLLIRLRRHEHGLMPIRIELLLLNMRLRALQPMLLQCAQKNLFGHLQPTVQIRELRIRRRAVLDGDLLRGHVFQRSVQIVDRFDEVACEARDGEIFGLSDLPLCTLLEITEISDRAEVFVLRQILASAVMP